MMKNTSEGWTFSKQLTKISLTDSFQDKAAQKERDHHRQAFPTPSHGNHNKAYYLVVPMRNVSYEAPSLSLAFSELI